jgi:hypothetical protein
MGPKSPVCPAGATKCHQAPPTPNANAASRPRQGLSHPETPQRTTHQLTTHLDCFFLFLHPPRLRAFNYYLHKAISTDPQPRNVLALNLLRHRPPCRCPAPASFSCTISPFDGQRLKVPSRVTTRPARPSESPLHPVSTIDGQTDSLQWEVRCATASRSSRRTKLLSPHVQTYRLILRAHFSVSIRPTTWWPGCGRADWRPHQTPSQPALRPFLSVDCSRTISSV